MRLIDIVVAVVGGVEMAAPVRFVDFVELAIGPAAAGGVAGGLADAVAVQSDGGGAQGGEAGADDAGAAFDFGPYGGVDGAPFWTCQQTDAIAFVRGGREGADMLVLLIWPMRAVRRFA